jgi:cell division septum initiation protein DivIVA
MLNGSTSVKDKFTDLQNENEALKDRLEQLEQTLMQVLQRGNHD